MCLLSGRRLADKTPEATINENRTRRATSWNCADESSRSNLGAHLATYFACPDFAGSAACDQRGCVRSSRGGVEAFP